MNENLQNKETKKKNKINKNLIYYRNKSKNQKYEKNKSLFFFLRYMLC